jgi:methionyl-tRNA synthetase
MNDNTSVAPQETAQAASADPANASPNNGVASTPPLDPIEIGDFMKVALRVGKILAVESVPKSKKLLKLQVDLGVTLGTRQIVSGIAQHYSAEQLIGKRIVVVANLKPALLMGVESNGMLLAASSDDNSVLALIEPAETLPLGSTVR